MFYNLVQAKRYPDWLWLEVKMKCYYCSVCERVFNRKKHLTHHHLNEHTTTRRYKSYLGEGLNIKFIAIPQSHNEGINSHRYSNKTTKKCKYCNRIFYHNDALQNHQKNVHLEKKKLRCSKCQKNFSRLGNLRRHKKHCDGDKQTNYQCNNCQNNFTRLDALVRHRKKCIYNEKLYKCDKCLKRFAQRNNYILHRNACSRRQHPTTQESHRLKFKNKKQKPLYINFRRSMKLKKYKKQQDGGSIQSKYKCNQCEKKFTRLDAFIRHRKQYRHDKARYQCNRCIKYFVHNDNFLQHQKICICELQRHSNEQKPCGSGLNKKCIKWANNTRKKILKHISRSNNNRKKDKRQSVIGNIQCNHCNKRFSRFDVFIRHRRRYLHSDKVYQCNRCLKRFSRYSNLIQHQEICTSQKHLEEQCRGELKRKRKKSMVNNFEIEVVETAFKNAVITYRIKLKNEGLDEAIFAMEKKLQAFRFKEHALKFSMAIHVEFEKATNANIITDPAIVLQSEQFEIYKGVKIKIELEKVIKQLEASIDTYEQCGSGWIVSRLLFLDCTIWKLDPLRASSSTFSKLPEWIINKGAIVNVFNKDDLYCFKWSVLAALHEPTNHKNLTYSYTKYQQEYDYSGLRFPVSLNQIKIFENKNNVSINVYGVQESDKKGEDGCIYPLKVTQCEKEKHINLLLTENNGLMHYSAIKNFSRLVRSQYTKCRTAHYYCYSCLHGFVKKKNENERKDCKLLKRHQKHCKTLNPQRTVFPDDDEKILKFTNIQKQLKAPFVAYADFESRLIDRTTKDDDISTKTFIREDKKGTAIKSSKKERKENIYQQHEVISYAYKIISIDPSWDEPIEVYKGVDAIDKFITSLQEKTKKLCDDYIRNPKEQPTLTVEEKSRHESSTHCHICNQIFKDDEKKIEDHCHILGTYRGAAHNACNLNYSITTKSWKLPVIFHNLKGYDGHFIIKALKKKHGRIRVIPTNIEKYMAFSVGKLQFLDSYQFANESLDNLVKTLNDDEMIFTKKHFNRKEQFDMVKQKGIFPYDYIDSIERFEETELPNIRYFNNKLRDTKVKPQDYFHAKLTWKKLGCKNLGDYHDVYLKSDVLLLADFFEKFRNTCIKNYNLDCVNYVSSPSLAWDSALKMTNIQLELLQDKEIYDFIERGIRGGISIIAKRFARANNPGCRIRKFDPTRKLKHLIYLDANNLYGFAMSQALPIKDFRFLDKDEIRKISTSFGSIDDDAETGYIFEVDLKYPAEIHDRHNCLPLAPERVLIDDTWYSPFQKQFPKQLPQERLTPNLMDKKRYIVHYRNLKLYTDLGMEVSKVHRVLSFTQSKWLKQYIDYNTECRKLSKSKFEKDFYKLMNNAVYGKTNENLRNRINVEVITDRKIALKRIAKPAFKRSQIIHEDLVIIQSAITTLKLNKPIYVGFSVLELSKVLMYDYHYNHIKRKYKDGKVNLMFSDTDSLLYEIETDDIYKDLEQDKDMYDFSDYPPDHFLQSDVNKKKIGKFKDELNGKTLEEFCGLRSKCYSLLYDCPREKRKLTAKGCVESVKKDHFEHEHYLETLFEKKTFTVSQNIIKSRAHQVCSYNVKKTALTAYDVKRWICCNGVDTLAHGHYHTNNNIKCIDKCKHIIG